MLKIFKVMKNLWVPWEIYFMDRLKNNSRPLIQIGIACSTLLTDKFMFNAEGKKIALTPLFYNYIRKKKDGSDAVGVWNTQNYYSVRNLYKNKKNFVIPE